MRCTVYIGFLELVGFVLIGHCRIYKVHKAHGVCSVFLET